MKAITLLGSTGSIGTSALDVVRRNSNSFEVYGLAAGRNVESLSRQITEFRPSVCVLPDAAAVDSLFVRLLESGFPKTEWPELLSGPAGLVTIATASECDVLLSAIVGVAGLEATYEAARLGRRVALANKEVLVSAGELIMRAARASGCELIPVDSEHNGAHQCLRAGRRSEAVKLILTASGGPFRRTPATTLATVTPQQALDHPTWKMGKRITIDSATLMNKGFEVIEACWLFDFLPSEVEVVVHPESTVHALVEFVDGSVIAQVCATDMRMPIQYALSWPDRDVAPVPKMDWGQSRTWNFEPPDFDRFPLLRLAYEAQAAGGISTCILNAADEVAVEAFLGERIGFTQIYEIVADVLERIPQREATSIGDILEIDKEARRIARELVPARAMYGIEA